MKQSDAHLFVGPAEFADPTLLISGDAQSLSWLAERIESREITELPLGHPTFFVSDRSIRLIPTDTVAGRLDERRGRYEWRIGAQQAVDYAERLRVLARSSRPGHAYLDTKSPLQIVASQGEYDPRDLTRGAPKTTL